MLRLQGDVLSTVRSDQVRRFLTGFRASVKRVVSGYVKEAADRVRTGKQPIPIDYETRWRSALLRAERPWITTIVNTAMTQVKRELGRTKSADDATMIAMGGWDQFVLSPIGARVDGWLEEVASKTTKTHAKQLQDVYEKASTYWDPEKQRGMTVAEMARQIQGMDPEYSARRADLIAVTNTNYAYNAGIMDEYKTQGITTFTWFTTMDDAVCEFCAEMDGRQISDGKPFFEKGDSLSVPKPKPEPKPVAPMAAPSGTPIASGYSNKEEARWLEDRTLWRNENAAKLGITPELFESQQTEMIKQALDDAVPVVRVPSKGILDQVLADGEFKSQFVTGKSSGYLDLDTRREVERAVFGVAKETDDAARQIYGYMEPKFSSAADFKDRKTADQYGDVVAVFKPSVRDSVKVTGTDSFIMGTDLQPGSGLPDGIYLKSRPASLNNPTTDLLSFDDKPLAKAADLFHIQRVDGAYVEAQFTAGAKVADIDKLIFTQNAPSAKQVKAMERLGVKWEVVPK